MSNSNRSVKTALITLSIAIFAAGATSAMAEETKWEKRHPRRDQVNDRLANQNKRIHKEAKEGEITKDQAKALHQEDHQIRQEERDMASQNGGHITRTEKQALNQQENAVSKEIGK